MNIDTCDQWQVFIANRIERPSFIYNSPNVPVTSVTVKSPEVSKRHLCFSFFHPRLSFYIFPLKVFSFITFLIFLSLDADQSQLKQKKISHHPDFIGYT